MMHLPYTLKNSNPRFGGDVRLVHAIDARSIKFPKGTHLYMNYREYSLASVVVPGTECLLFVGWVMLNGSYSGIVTDGEEYDHADCGLVGDDFIELRKNHRGCEIQVPGKKELRRILNK